MVRKKQSRFLLHILKILVVISLLILIILGIRKTVKKTDLFTVSRVIVTGTHILTHDEVLEIAGIQSGENIFRLEIGQIQHDLEALPWIKAALVSRIFPDVIRIRIIERVPICLLKADKLYALDDEFVVLPMIRGPFLYDVPVLTGFMTDSLEIVPGVPLKDREIQNSLVLLLGTYLSHPLLYNDISELHRDESGNYILYSRRSGTSIYLGRVALQRKMEILGRFRELLGTQRLLSDFQYLDLRWENQIVARERI